MLKIAFAHRVNSKNNGPVMFVRTVFETAPSDGKERHGIETVKIGPFFFFWF